MQNWTDFQWAVSIGGFFLLISILTVGTLYLKYHFQRAVRGKILCEFIPRVGKAYKKLLPDLKNGRVEIPLKEGKTTGKTFIVSGLVSYPVDYPEGLPNIIQVEAQKVVFFEDHYEPVSNRSGMPIGSPELLYNVIHEKFSGLGVATAKELLSQIRGGGLSGNQWVNYILMSLSVGGVGYLIYFCYEQFNAIRAGLGI